MCWINLLRQNGDLQAGQPVSDGGARYQQLSGGAVQIPEELSGGPPQGAHVLPSLIRIGSRDVTQIPRDPRHQRILKNLVGTVVVLPAEYNSADLMAEQNGLAQALVDCCRRIMNETPDGPGDGGKVRIERSRVRSIYEQTWVGGAAAVFDELVGWDDSRYSTNWKGRPDHETADFMRQILSHYRQALSDRRCTSDIYMDFTERDFDRPDTNSAVASERGKVFPIFAEPSFSENIWKRLGQG